MIPADSENISQEFLILKRELEMFNPDLLDKKRILAITKSDMLDNEMMEQMKTDIPDIPYVFISSVAQHGLTELKDMIWKYLDND